jgi:2,3-bisphosphoglycerate-dependent phosphoglycerate mutase
MVEFLEYHFSVADVDFHRSLIRDAESIVRHAPGALFAGAEAACELGNPVPVTTIYLIRHAQSLPRPELEEADWALSPVGEAQARGLVPVLRALNIRRLYSSPYRRCRDTLAPYASAAGLDIVLESRLRERRIAAGWISDFRDVWRRSWEDFSYALDGGESSWSCRQRIAVAVDTIVARHPGEIIGLGSHGNAIALFLHYVDPTFTVADASAIRTPEISRVVHRDGRFVWERAFSAGPVFEALATDFRETPGVVA